MTREYSAGGVVTRNGKILIVRVRNLQGALLWTLPKGHLDPGETPRQAALREVEEETGLRCRILRPLMVVRYRFMRGDRLVRKRVRWYWMRPEAKVRAPDAEEVLGVRWASPETARKFLRYPGDLRLVGMLAPRLRRNGDGL